MNPQRKHVVFVGPAVIYDGLQKRLDGITMHYPIDKTGQPEFNLDLFLAAFDSIRSDPTVVVLDDEHIGVRTSVRELRTMLDTAKEHGAQFIFLEKPDEASSRFLIEQILGSHPLCLDSYTLEINTIALAVNELLSRRNSNPERDSGSPEY